MINKDLQKGFFIMKTFKRRITGAVLSGIIAASTMICSASAYASTAASFGIKYYDTSSSTTYDDFTTNAINAKNAYASIAAIGSNSVRYSPTTTTLNNRITEDVVFLNSHANVHHMRFKFYNNSNVYTDVKLGDSSASSPDVNISNKNLSGVYLISFVGCLTGSGSSNITKSAVSSGAHCALGFTDEISSRSTNGKNWLISYNNYLAQGKTVTYAVSHATVAYPSSNLGDYAVIEGSGSTTIAAPSSKGVEKNLISEINLPLEFENRENLTVNEDSIEALTKQMYTSIPNFDSKKYKIEQNMFQSDSKTGIVKYNYYIDNTIKTNKAYVVYIEEGVAKEILYSLADYKKDICKVDENSLIEKVSKFQKPESITKSCEGETKNILNDYIEYIYDYKTDELMYCETAYYYDSADDVIIDDVNEVVIK